EGTGGAFESGTRPNPCSLLGNVSGAERETVPDPVTGTPEAIKRARIRAALGVIASAASGRPDGYQPSVKYCRRIAAAAAAAGVESLVPNHLSSGCPLPLRGFPSDIAEPPSKIATIVGSIRPST